MIRFCDHELKLSAGTATADDAAEIAEMQVEGMDENLRKRLDSVAGDALKLKAENMDSIEFNGKAIPLESEKIRVAILQVTVRSLTTHCSLTDLPCRLKSRWQS